MTILVITAVLFVLTALLHIDMLRRFGNTATTRPVAAYGMIYLILGILLLTTNFSWLPLVAFILTALGAVGATTQINAAPEMRSWTLLFIGIDAVIIILLLYRTDFMKLVKES